MVSQEDTTKHYLWFHCFTEGCQETKKTSHRHYITWHWCAVCHCAPSRKLAAWWTFELLISALCTLADSELIPPSTQLISMWSHWKNKYFVIWLLIPKENMIFQQKKENHLHASNNALRASKKILFAVNFFRSFEFQLKKQLLQGCRKRLQLPSRQAYCTVQTSLYNIWITNVLVFFCGHTTCCLRWPLSICLLLNLKNLGPGQGHSFYNQVWRGGWGNWQGTPKT